MVDDKHVLFIGWQASLAPFFFFVPVFFCYLLCWPSVGFLLRLFLRRPREEYDRQLRMLLLLLSPKEEKEAQKKKKNLQSPGCVRLAPFRRLLSLRGISACCGLFSGCVSAVFHHRSRSWSPSCLHHSQLARSAAPSHLCHLSSRSPRRRSERRRRRPPPSWPPIMTQWMAAMAITNAVSRSAGVGRRVEPQQPAFSVGRRHGRI